MLILTQLKYLVKKINYLFLLKEYYYYRLWYLSKKFLNGEDWRTLFLIWPLQSTFMLILLCFVRLKIRDNVILSYYLKIYIWVYFFYVTLSWLFHAVVFWLPKLEFNDIYKLVNVFDPPHIVLQYKIHYKWQFCIDLKQFGKEF